MAVYLFPSEKLKKTIDFATFLATFWGSFFGLVGLKLALEPSMNLPPSSESADANCDQSLVGWSPGKRSLASIAILVFLLIVVLGPLSNPIASENLTKPLAEDLAPFHRAMFLGHGYRFFGPDPGPSHLVYYTVKKADGGEVEGHFPDADSTWPRLLYHRWFMLSESIYDEHKFTPDKVGFDQSQQALTNEILAMRDAGNFAVVKKLEQARLEQREQYENARLRIDLWIDAIAKQMTSRHGGDRAKLFVRERLIASPLDVSAGIKLDDERYLLPPIPIGPGLEELPSHLPSRDQMDPAEPRRDAG